MSLLQVLREFADDKQLSAVALLVAADVVFGVLAALKTRTFDFKRLADFARDDLLGKVVPWLAVFGFGKVTHGDAILGVNFSTISDAVFGLVAASLVASLLTSFQDLGLPLPAAAAKVGIGRGAAAYGNASDVPDQGNADAAASDPKAS